MDKKIVKSPYSDYIGNNIYGEYKPEYKAYYERLNSRYPMNRFKIEWTFLRGDSGFSYKNVPKTTPMEWVLDQWIEDLFRYNQEYKNNKDHTFKLRFQDLCFGIRTDRYLPFKLETPYYLRIPIHQIPGILLFEIDQDWLQRWNSDPEPIIDKYYKLEYERLRQLNIEHGFEDGSEFQVHDNWLCRQPEAY